MEIMIENIQQQQLDNKMQKGYACLKRGDSVAACREWNELWKNILKIMDTNKIKYMEEMDRNVV